MVLEMDSLIELVSDHRINCCYAGSLPLLSFLKLWLCLHRHLPWRPQPRYPLLHWSPCLHLHACMGRMLANPNRPGTSLSLAEPVSLVIAHHNSMALWRSIFYGVLQLSTLCQVNQWKCMKFGDGGVNFRRWQTGSSKFGSDGDGAGSCQTSANSESPQHIPQWHLCY